MKFPGGKGSTYQTFINLIPPHEVYIESHLGGGAIMRYKRIAKRNIGVEINPKVIEMWENLDQTDLELVNGDAITFLKNYNYTGQEFIYCDPPYLRHTRKRLLPLYTYEYSREQHIELLEVIKTIPSKVMISGYDSPLYSESLI